MLKICLLNLVLVMRGLHKMLETVNIYYAYFHRGLNKNIIMSSFKSSGDIQKKEDGPDSCFG